MDTPNGLDIIALITGVGGLIASLGVVIDRLTSGRRMAKQTDLEQQKHDLEELRVIIQELREENKRYRENNGDYMTRLAQLEGERKELDKKIATLEKERIDQGKLLDKKDIEINDLNHRLELLTCEVERLRDLLKDKKDK